MFFLKSTKIWPKEKSKNLNKKGKRNEQDSKNWVQDRSIKCSKSDKYNLKMFKALNYLNSSNSLNLLNSLNCFVWFQTCLNLFKFNMIWIVTIQMILKHVWTCTNISELVQIQYDMNCNDSCDSQTCLNMLKHV